MQQSVVVEKTSVTQPTQFVQQPANDTSITQSITETIVMPGGSQIVRSDSRMFQSGGTYNLSESVQSQQSQFQLPQPPLYQSVSDIQGSDLVQSIIIRQDTPSQTVVQKRQVFVEIKPDGLYDKSTGQPYVGPDGGRFAFPQARQVMQHQQLPEPVNSFYQSAQFGQSSEVQQVSRTSITQSSVKQSIVEDQFFPTVYGLPTQAPVELMQVRNGSVEVREITMQGPTGGAIYYAQTGTPVLDRYNKPAVLTDDDMFMFTYDRKNPAHVQRRLEILRRQDAREKLEQSQQFVQKSVTQQQYKQTDGASGDSLFSYSLLESKKFEQPGGQQKLVQTQQVTQISQIQTQVPQPPQYVKAPQKRLPPIASERSLDEFYDQKPLSFIRSGSISDQFNS
ncbi:MAG: hypothetical protein KF874_11955 [Rhizobiaceae bacterium]|nr:hypothetical protein [Rhizobiaceae bacterium]